MVFHGCFWVGETTLKIPSKEMQGGVKHGRAVQPETELATLGNRVTKLPLGVGCGAAFKEQSEYLQSVAAAVLRTLCLYRAVARPVQSLKDRASQISWRA